MRPPSGWTNGSKLILLGLALLWIAAVVSFFQSVVLTSPDARYVSSGKRSILIGLKGTQSVESTRFDVYDEPAGAIKLGVSSGRTLRSATATWVLNLHTISRFASNSKSLRSRLVFQQPVDPYSLRPGARIDVSINGVRRMNVNLTRRVRAPASVAARYVYTWPANSFTVRLIPFASDYVIPCVTLPLTGDDLDRDSLTVTLSTKGYVTWPIVSIQSYTVFTPRNSPLFRNRSLTLVLGLFVALGLVGGVGLVAVAFWRRARFVGLLAAMATLLLAIFSRDPWDLPVWSQLLDISAFGGGSPAYAWTGTPLWSFVPGIFAPLLALLNDWFGRVPEVVNFILLKTGLWIAFATVAIQLYDLAPKAWKRITLLVWFLSPFSLFLCSWGVRDLLSTAIVLAAFRLITRRQFIASAVVLAIAASIDEYFAPVLILPCFVFLLTSRRSIWRAAQSGLLGILPFVLIGAQWFALGKGYASGVLGYRLGVTFMDCTWQFLLQQAGLLPAFFLYHESLIFVIAYCLISLAFFIRLWKLAFSNVVYSVRDAFAVSLLPLTGCVAAFFLSYGQADHQEWFGLMMLLQVAAFRLRSLAPVVSLFMLIAGFDIYAHVGLREFLSPAFFNLSYVGLWQTRGVVDRILIGTCLALIAVTVVFLAKEKDRPLFGSLTRYVIVLWFGALLSISTALIGNDLILIGFAAAALTALIGAFDASEALPIAAALRMLAAPAILIGGAIFAQGAPWAVIALAVGTLAAILAVPEWRATFAHYRPVDVVLLVSAFAFLAAPIERLSLANFSSGATIIWSVLIAIVFAVTALVPRYGLELLVMLGIVDEKKEEPLKVSA